MMTPKTEEELSEMIRAANERLVVQGGGTRGMGGVGQPLSTAGLSGVTLYEPGALTLVAKSGTPVADIEQALAAEGQRLAFEPMDHRALLGTTGTPTIGGIVAGNISGPRRVQVGAARDFALGVRFVNGVGDVVKNGGRVMKNVTGYDLVKLMSGSWGTLGVLSEVSLKVLPVAETTATLVIDGLDPMRSVQAMSAALGAPFDVTGAARDAQGRTLVRLEGFEDSVAYRAGALAERLAQFGEVTQIEGTEDWISIKDVTAFAGQSGDVWKVSVKPSDGPAVLAATAPDDMVMDWGGGLVWLRVREGTDLRGKLAGIPGHATLVRGQGQPRFHPEPAGVAALSVGIRAKFDPRGIFNPGLMTDEAA